MARGRRPARGPREPKKEVIEVEGVIREARPNAMFDVELANGHHVDAMQYVANAIAARETDSPRRRVVVEVAGYRERRVAALEAQARAAADRALAEAVPQELEPMGAADRRAVHECLADDPRVETASSGDEPHRRVVVTPSSHGS